jgi:YidC/Oxa1 family membrane protein insertase
MNIFELILSPFIFIIKQLFLFGYHLTGNYGWAIILLSFFISLLLLPVFIYIEKAKKKTDAVKRKMQPLVDEIKRCYKGQERYYYLKTLNRQHGYSPLKAMIPILSLLLQIPFFIAAYQYLEHFEPLQGVSFGFIKDMSQPDGLFGAINILPIAMTVVNLITAWFYTRNGNTGERKQMLIVALAFLILLYKLPAGLVLYWTMNNVFSFFRLFITNPEVFRKTELQKNKAKKELSNFKQQAISLLPKYKYITIIIISIFIWSQISWALKYYFNDIFIRILIAIISGIVLSGVTLLLNILFLNTKDKIFNLRIKPIVFNSLLFLSIYFFFSAKFYFTGVNTELTIISLLTFLVLQYIGFIYFINYKPKISSIAYLFILFILTTIVLFQLLSGIVIISGNEIDLHIFNILISVKKSLPISLITIELVFVVIVMPFYYKTEKQQFSITVHRVWLIQILSLLFISGLIFLWHPLLVYSSSPQTFGFPSIDIIKNNFELFYKTLLFSIILFSLLPKKIKYIWTYILLAIVIISFINSSVFPIQLGSLQESRFSEQEKLAAPIVKYIIEAIFILSVIYFINFIIKKKNTKYLTTGLIILNILFITNSLFQNRNNLLNNKKRNEHSTSDNKVISFSKSKKNIVFFIADGVQGWFIKQIIKENPELKDIFSGFTWYSNTVSMANYTHASVPSMLAGYNFSIDKMNADSKHSIEEKWQISAEIFVNNVISKGYKMNSDYQHYFNKVDTLINNIPLWRESWKESYKQIHLGQKEEIWYNRLYENTLLYCVPLAFKPKIYNNQKWFEKDKIKISNYMFDWYNFLRLLPHISDTTSKKPNFIFFHNEAAHNPWHIIKDNGNIVDASPYDNNKWYILQLAKWIEWMKANDVYNNTNIVIVSDHGPSWYESEYKPDFDSPVDWNNNSINIDDRMFWRLQPLLMVKEFNTKGELKENKKLMCNADASYITFNSNYADSIPNNRILKTYFTNWVSKMEEQKRMDIYKEFTVDSCVFDLRRWKQIKQKTKEKQH